MAKAAVRVSNGNGAPKTEWTLSQIVALAREAPKSELPTESGLMEITPGLAADWLRRNAMNRPLNSSLVAHLVAEIEGGRWQVNGQTISFRMSGTLNDGQHRLAAILAAGRSVQSFVIIGIPDSAFVTVDTGKPRGPKDALALAGFKHAIVIAAAARWQILYEKGELTIHGRGQAKSGSKSLHGSRKISNQEILVMAQTQPGLRAAAARQLNHEDPRLRRLLSPSLAVFLDWRVRDIAGERGATFMRQITEGVDLKPGTGPLLLREKLLTETTAPRKLPYTYRLAWAIKAFNLFINDRPADRLTYDPVREKEFPRFTVGKGG